MQLMIDIAAEAPTALRLAAQFLLDHAALREAMEAGAGMPPSPTRAASVPAAPPVPSHAAPPPPVIHADFPPPPFVPPPPAPAVAPVLPSATTNGTESSIASGTDQFDASGVPFDIRIHQKTGNKKKDGTWKIRKGLNDGVVESVMRELAPRVRIGSQPTVTPAPAGASAPVSLPPIPPPPGPAFVPPPPAIPSTGQAAPSAAPPPPPDTAGTSSEAQAPPDPFRALVLKITKARAANRLTPEEVIQCVTGAGAPSLQLLNNMPHLIPSVDAAIDSILAVR